MTLNSEKGEQQGFAQSRGGGEMGMLGIPHSHRHCTSRVILSVSKKVDFLEFQLQGKKIGVLINVKIPSGIWESIGGACKSGSRAANPVFWERNGNGSA